MEVAVVEKRHSTTTVTTKTDIREALAQGVLTPEEERVLRMRHGISEKPSAVLELKGQAHEETRAKLAMIENLVLETVRGGVAPSEERKNSSQKQHIINRLRNEE
jgi:DNA-directed RNA polymerase sigma subunit (sigma70/sigma32)